MPKVSVCLSPELFEKHLPFEGAIVVIDVFRATSTICAAFEGGVKTIFAVAQIEQAHELKLQYPNAVLVGERDGKMIEGFDEGNSPEAFLSGNYAGKEVILTTTNGTKALQAAEATGNPVWIGALMNYQAIVQKLAGSHSDVLLFCAGWKGRLSLEDSLCAGLIAQELQDFGFALEGDEARMAFALSASGNIETVLKDASHRQRLEKLGISRDMEISMHFRSEHIPVFKKGKVEIV